MSIFRQKFLMTLVIALSLSGCGDLQPVSSSAPDVVCVGESIDTRTQLMITNTGPDPIETEFQVGWYLSSDEEWDSDDQLLRGGQHRVGGLAVDEVRMLALEEMSIPNDALTGERFLIAYIDDQVAVEEPDKRNNFAVNPITVRGATAPGCPNPIVLENRLPGTRNWQITEEELVTVTDWETAEDSLSEIEGYASQTSVFPGELIEFFVSTSRPTPYTFDIYRMGWYSGDGGRFMFTRQLLGERQARCEEQSGFYRLVECDWEASVRLNIPDNWITGTYLVKLTELTSNKASYIPFVVKDRGTVAPILMLTAVNTYQAYNQYGGHSFYKGGREGQANMVSFNRPYNTDFPKGRESGVPFTNLADGWGRNGAADFTRFELQFVRFLEKNGYNVGYGTNIDAHVGTNLFAGPYLMNRRAILSVGHDEYWSWRMRVNVSEARNLSCTNLAFFSGNSVYERVRFAPSVLNPSQSNRTMIGFKNKGCNKITRDSPPEDIAEFCTDPYFHDDIPENDHLITGQWRNPRGESSAFSESELMGVEYRYHSPRLNVPMNLIEDQIDSHWALLGVTENSIPGIVGLEADRVDGTRFERNTIDILAETQMDSSFFPFASDTRDCNDAEPPGCVASMTVYQHESGAEVFAAGTVTWSMALDEFVPPITPLWNVPLSTSAQQITHNVLERFQQPIAGVNCQATQYDPPR